MIAGIARNQRAALGVTDKIDFYFDEQAKEKGEIAEAWEWYKEIAIGEHKDLLGSFPSFMDDKKLLPLQAADLVAWWVRKLAIEEADHVRRLMFPWVSERQIPGIQIYYDEKRIRATCETLISAAGAQADLSSAPPC